MKSWGPNDATKQDKYPAKTPGNNKPQSSSIENHAFKITIQALQTAFWVFLIACSHKTMVAPLLHTLFSQVAQKFQMEHYKIQINKTFNEGCLSLSRTLCNNKHQFSLCPLYIQKEQVKLSWHILVHSLITSSDDPVY